VIGRRFSPTRLPSAIGGRREKHAPVGRRAGRTEMTKKRQFCPRGHDTFQVGRDASKRCLQCKAEDAAFRVALHERALAERYAEFERRQVELDRRQEEKYQAAIKRGGPDAANARWDRAYTEALEKGWYGLCQWEDEIDGQYVGRMCFRRTGDVYCGIHNRQLERESARERRKREAEQSHDPPSKPPQTRETVSPVSQSPRRAPRPRRHREPESRWGQYKRDHPERARLYKSAARTSARDRQLREHPNCAACGAKASVADHVLNRARGGADLDPRNLQSLCRRCHHAKTIQESHRGMKRAAERRNR
jgi:5-methylcytosine-specific restriction enzyme A